jgi:uncharacterized protein YidB (DUF937 family)
MGLLDGLISSVMNAALGGAGQSGAASPLGGLLSSLSAGLGASAGAAGAPAGAPAGAGALGAGGLLAAAMGLVQSQGGISGLVAKLEQSGLGQHANSWVGGGPNMPVSGDQLTQALGAGALGQIAAKLGVSPAQAGATMAQILPELINHLTPSGQVPQDQHSLLADGLKMLQGLQHS